MLYIKIIIIMLFSFGNIMQSLGNILIVVECDIIDLFL